MNLNNQTGSLINASYEVIDAEIKAVLNGAPFPDISPLDISIQPSISRNFEYHNEYLALADFVSDRFAGASKLEVNKYGFSEWTSSHPLINKLTHANYPLHWHHMKSIVERLERQIRIKELESGQRYKEEDRIELIAAKATEERLAERDRLLDEQMRSVVNRVRQGHREFERSRNQPASVEQPKSVLDHLISFNNKNPFTTGFIGAAIYHKLKDTFAPK